MKLHELRPKPGAHQPPRRLGRGHGSGRGKTAGRGTKGQKSRTGGGIPAWFEGGQTPLHIRTPKLHGFKNRFRVDYAPVNLAKISSADKGSLITPDVLVHDGLLRDTKLPVKVLGNGEAPAGVTVHAHAFSRSALDKLQAAGSTVQRISWPGGLPVEETPEASETDDTAPAKPRRQRGRAAADDGDAAADDAQTQESAPEGVSASEEVSAPEQDLPATDSEAEPEGESES
jgi:large subunit ribosomal protein L15